MTRFFHLFHLTSWFLFSGFLATAQNATGLSYYNTCPESPDGQQVAYVKFDANANEEGKGASGSLWVCDANLSVHEKLCDIGSLSYHNGASVQWVDNQYLAFMDGGNIKVLDVRTGQVVYGPFAGSIGHEVYQGKLLYIVNKPYGEKGKGVYELNTRSGQHRQVLALEDLYPIEDQLPRDSKRKDWRLLHAQWSPHGQRIALRLDISRSRSESHKILLSIKPDGSDPVIFGPKPMHFLWYDDHSFAGHDNQIDDGMPDDRSLRRWDCYGNYVETLAGPGNHLALSPDRQLSASESWYKSPNISLQVYQKGSTSPAEIIFTHPYAEITWEKRAHVNPSFSRDGQRLYFNRATSEREFQVASADVSALAPGQGQPMIFASEFRSADLDAWQVESRRAEVKVVASGLEIDAADGCTVWLKEKLQAPLSIDFAVTVMDEEQPNDRVSDMNVFWMAEDPRQEDLLAVPRQGDFSDYHGLRQYYVGMGGHSNSKTRFRRYTGNGDRPLLPEHDLTAPEYLLQANVPMQIRIEVDQSGTRYFRDGRLIYHIVDDDPYLQGWFGFRTVRNRMRIHYLTISRWPE